VVQDVEAVLSIGTVAWRFHFEEKPLNVALGIGIILQN
jgi:hypothetical protein